MRALLEQVQSVDNRRAVLVSTLVAVKHPDDPEPLIAVGRAVGEITRQPIGDKGFGFDPIMYIPRFGKPFAELPVEVKNANDPRGHSSRQMLSTSLDPWFGA